MDPFFWRTALYVIVFIGTGLVLVGSIGTWFFSNRAERVGPYRQPIRTASATIDLLVESDEQVDTMYADQGGYLVLAKGSDPLFIVSATECTARQLGNSRVLFRGVFSMDANDRAAGRPVNYLSQAEYAQIMFRPMRPEAHVIGGTAVITINSLVRIEIKIPDQQIKDQLVFARDLSDTFRDLP